MPVLEQPLTTLYPARPAARPMTAEDLWRIPRVGAPEVAADSRTLVVPVTTYDLGKNAASSRLFLVNADGSGESRALTGADASAAEPRLSPDGSRLAFTRKDAAGRPQLMLLPMAGGEARRLTDLPLGVFDARWLPDGSGLVCAGMLVKGHLTAAATAAELKRRAEDPVKAHVTEDRVYRYWDTWLTTGEVVHLWHVDATGGAVRDITPEAEIWFDWMDPAGQYDLSPDGRDLVLAGVVFDAKRSLLRSHVFTVPVAGGPLTCLTGANPAESLRPRWSPDGAFVVYGRTTDPEFYADHARLWRWDRATGAHSEWLGGWDRWPTHWEFAADGTLVIAAEDNARGKLWAWNGGGAPRELTRDGTAAGHAVAGDGRVFCTLQSLAQPAEIHAVGLDGGGATRVTRFTDEAARAFATGEVRELTFTGARGETVQMFVVLPPGFTPGTKHPLVHVVHGGPHGISADSFHARWNAQLFAAPGYVTALVNFQGSTSWGQDFAQRIQGEWAARPFEDVMRATDALVATGWIDESRMAASGGSYGGYLMTWIAGHTDRFRCIVNHAGVSDLTGQYASDVTQGRGRAAGGEAWDGLDRQDRWSPIRFASGMATPMLVLHGERDYRVPVGQGLLVYGVLKAKGVPARLVYFPDENHWILKPRNSLLWYREVHDWLERWLTA